MKIRTQLSLSLMAAAVSMAANGARSAAPAAGAAAGGKDDIKAALPVIPDNTVNLKDFGGVGDFIAMNTDAFKKAIAALAEKGGGHLVVPPGTYKTLPFQLISHMDLHIEAGAVIKAPETFKEYGVPDPNDAVPGAGGGRGRGGGGNLQPLITAVQGATDIAITGTGVIDGSGAEFWIWSDKAVRHYPPGRISIPRPYLVSLNGQRIHVDGVTIMNSPMFHLVPRGSDITIENVRIVAPSDAPNSDAMDPGGERIVIRNCEIDVGDDNVAIQNGSKDVLIEDLTCFHGHGISIGSGTSRGVSHMIVRRCNFNGTDNGLRIKSNRQGGGDVHDIWYSDITMRNVRRPFDINMLYNGNNPITLPNGQTTDVGLRPATGQPSAIDFHDVHFSNITVVKSPITGRLLGLPEKLVHDITFTNIKSDTNRGVLVQDGKGITFENCTIKAAVGDPLVLDNGEVKFNGVAKSGTSGGPSDVFYGGN